MLVQLNSHVYRKLVPVVGIGLISPISIPGVVDPVEDRNSVVLLLVTVLVYYDLQLTLELGPEDVVLLYLILNSLGSGVDVASLP